MREFGDIGLFSVWEFGTAVSGGMVFWRWCLDVRNTYESGVPEFVWSLNDILLDLYVFKVKFAKLTIFLDSIGLLIALFCVMLCT